MKRFAVFAGDKYYAFGGMSDYQISFETREGAAEWVAASKAKPRYPDLFGSTDPAHKWAQTKFGDFDWYEIEDMDTRE